MKKTKTPSSFYKFYLSILTTKYEKNNLTACINDAAFCSL